MRYTYSRWDKAQDAGRVDADELMEALAEDLIADGDVWKALQRVTRWGLEQDGDQDGHWGGTRHLPGLQHLLQRLRTQRQHELERYNLDSLLQDIQKQVAEIVETERRGVERRLEEACGQGKSRPERHPASAGGTESREPAASAGGTAVPGPAENTRKMLEAIAERKRAFLDALPSDPGPAITALADYEFLDEEARDRFQDLLKTLQEQVLQSHSQSIRESLQSMSAQELAHLKGMLHDLNQVLKDRLEDDDPDFAGFMQRHGRYFPDAQSLDHLVEQMQEQAAYTESLLRSMSPEMRQSVEGMMESVLHDEDLRRELAQTVESLYRLAPPRRPQRRYPFSGEESLSLTEALQLMRRLHELDELEKSMRQAQDSGDLTPLDGELVHRLMGDEAYRAIERLKQLAGVLEEAGYIEKTADSFELTTRAIRKIGQRALQDIFRRLKHEAFGRHATPLPGVGGDRTDDSKRYEFGDAFLLDMHKTLMNSIHREGPGSPLSLSVQDFEVFRTEYLTRSSTVLMLDMSRSMPLRGCFVAAKKVAFALNTLIRTQFPRDRLYIIGFSDFARELRPETLHQLTWGDYVYGTNMQHGFMMARRLLGRYATANKQIILITDGEPTAHFEAGRVHFSYPPTFRTFQETLREVKRCTQEGIVINTFMLERSHYLADFVNQMTRINRGRAFFATPDRLGDYILVDYVQSKQNRTPAGALRR